MKSKYLTIGGFFAIILIIIGMYVALLPQQTTRELTTVRGEFTITKYGMGVVNETLIPYFQNNPEGEQYIGKIVEVTGYLYEPEYPSDYEGQMWGGDAIELASINIIEEN